MEHALQLDIGIGIGTVRSEAHLASLLERIGTQEKAARLVAMGRESTGNALLESWSREANWQLRMAPNSQMQQDWYLLVMVLGAARGGRVIDVSRALPPRAGGRIR